MFDENVASPSFVDVLASFSFVLILFLAVTVVLVSGVIQEHAMRGYLEGVSRGLGESGISNVIEGHKIRISLRDRVTFPINGSTRDANGRAHLRKIGEEVWRHQGFSRLVVQGHADRLPVKNDAFGNWKLSVERALEVLRFLYLCEDCGFDRDAIRTKLILAGEGDLDSAALGGKERASGRPLDRRVDLVLDFEDRGRVR